MTIKLGYAKFEHCYFWGYTVKFFVTTLLSLSLALVPMSSYANGKKSNKGNANNATTNTTATTTAQPARTGSSKNEKHGDGGRAQQSAEKQIAELKAQIYNGMPRNERLKIEQKIKNIKATAAKKAKGEEHSRTGKR